MDVKARSKAMREILTRLVDMERGGVDVKIFGDPVILEEGGSHIFLDRPVLTSDGRYTSLATCGRAHILLL